MHLALRKGSSTGSASAGKAKRWRKEWRHVAGLRISGRGEASHGDESISGRPDVGCNFLPSETPGSNDNKEL